MTKPANEIHSVKDLLDILDTLGEAEHGKTRFFRGHSKSSYLMLPSIYRQRYLIENEDKIIRDTIVNCPDDFSPNDTLFEKLVKLQHYGYTTRLLDLTSNALVALYFAALSQEAEDGELIILDIPDEQIKYDDSDTVAVLSAISLQKVIFFDLCKFQEDSDLNSIMKNLKFLKLTQEFAPFLQEEYEQNTTKLNHILKIKTADEFIEKISTYNKKIINENKINAFNEHPMIFPLLNTIRQDKPNFAPKIEYTDFGRIIPVRAKLNNARISRQQGLFLLFGINGTKVNPANVPDEWLRKVNNQKIIIKNKKQILRELKSFGISKQTLFPELESQAQEIMAQYKPK